MVQVCHICGQPLVGKDVAECDNCGRPFHLAMTQDSPTQDCGIVFPHEEHFFLIFLCLSCQPEPQSEERPGG